MKHATEDCCCDTLARKIAKLEAQVMIITLEKRFDLYHQNPWVAGSHMLSILSRAADCGVRLCNRGSDVGTVLHLYNFLRQFGYLETEDVLLERLCAVIGPAIFSGARPEQGFSSRYTLFLGGRLVFEGPRKHQRDHDNDACERADRTWRIAASD